LNRSFQRTCERDGNRGAIAGYLMSWGLQFFWVSVQRVISA